MGKHPKKRKRKKLSSEKKGDIDDCTHQSSHRTTKLARKNLRKILRFTVS